MTNHHARALEMATRRIVRYQKRERRWIALLAAVLVVSALVWIHQSIRFQTKNRTAR